MTDAPVSRIDLLDRLRGAAVLGILLANLPAFGLPAAAAFSPAAWGGRTGADQWAWALNFVFVEGRMRGLFSLLFGASLLLAAERAEAAGEEPGAAHFARMGWLFLFGLAHLYLLWWGDILAHYALVGCAAFAFRHASARALWLAAAALIGFQALTSAGAAAAAWDAAPGTPAWDALQAGFGAPPGAELRAEVAAQAGTFAQGVAWRWRTAPGPLWSLPAGGAETLGYMLMGMAALRSGWLERTRATDGPRLAPVLVLLTGWGLYAALAAGIVFHGFDARWTMTLGYAATVPVRPFAILAYAAGLAAVSRPGGRLGRRLGAAGRVAFSNYLGTSLAAGAVFAGWGLGLFGRLGRAELYWLVLPAWAAMLWWPEAWLRRYRTGPLEWLWRSLAARRPLPFRRPLPIRR